jgi:hypothetical protein
MKNSICNTVEGEVVGVYLTGDEVCMISSRGAERSGGEVPASSPKHNGELLCGQLIWTKRWTGFDFYSPQAERS